MFHLTDLTIFHFIIAFLLCFQVNEKLGHAEAMDNTSVDVMTHKKQKKHKKEKELEEEPTVVASAQYSPADSGQVSDGRTNLLCLILKKHPEQKEKNTNAITKGVKMFKRKELCLAEEYKTL